MFPAEKRTELVNEIKSNPNFKGAMFRSLTGLQYNNQVNYNKTRSIACKEIFMMLSVVIYVPKNFYLTEALNEKIAIFQAAGLIEHWHSQIIDPRYLKPPESKEPSGIKVEYLSGCFCMWIISCLIAFVVFVIEALRWRFTKNSEVDIVKENNAIRDLRNYSF